MPLLAGAAVTLSVSPSGSLSVASTSLLIEMSSSVEAMSDYATGEFEMTSFTCKTMILLIEELPS